MLDGVMEDVTDGVCDGVWLFGKDSFEECPLTVCTPLYTLLIIHIPPSFYFAYNHLLLFGYDLNLSCSQ